MIACNAQDTVDRIRCIADGKCDDTRALDELWQRLDEVENINPRGWDGPMWTLWLMQAAGMTDADAFYSQISLAPRILTCEKCRTHARSYIAEHPFPSSNDRHSAIIYVHDFRNSVRTRLGLKPFMLRSTLRELWRCIVWSNKGHSPYGAEYFALTNMMMDAQQKSPADVAKRQKQMTDFLAWLDDDPYRQPEAYAEHLKKSRALSFVQKPSSSKIGTNDKTLVSFLLGAVAAMTVLSL